ncbi:MAG: hypothetical protein ACRDYV_22490, partial [Acidimicrobiia bacterium]
DTAADLLAFSHAEGPLRATRRVPLHPTGLQDKRPHRRPAFAHLASDQPQRRTPPPPPPELLLLLD